MVNTDVVDEEWIDVSTCLLVQNVLLHGFVDFFSGHFILEFTTDGFVDLVHVRANVLPREDGWCTKNTHGLTAIVVGVGGVTTGSGVEPIIDGKVSDFVIALNGFTGHTVVILHVVLVKFYQIVVQVVDRGVRLSIKSFG